MKCFLSRSLGILVAATLSVAGGCSDQPMPQQSRTSGQKPADAKDSAVKPADTKPADAKPMDTKPVEKKPADANPVSGYVRASETKPAPSKPAVDEKKMRIVKEVYAQLPDETQIEQYTLSNSNGLKVKIINYGAVITAVETPDRNGKIENITLHRDSLADYMEMKNGKPTTPYFGATIGRYGNRIAKGRFTLNGKEYTLKTNDGPNALHGGLKGFDKVVWNAEPVKTPDAVGVAFTYTSPDGEEGYPGTLKTKVTYSLTDKDELKMDYEATTDKDTVLNLTNHAYWNLAGASNGDILKHEIVLHADRFLPVDATLIPLGRLDPVKGTAMDFTSPKAIGKDIAQVEGGYDHCYVLVRKNDGLSLAARVTEPTSGRAMEVYTTQPAIQFYTGNFLDGTIHADGKAYDKHYAFCLETQHYPDSPNEKEFPTTVLKPGETYKQSTVHKFTVQK
ncbi:MAG: galactose-1-epimerase [Thermoguttaceae bacterium]